MRRRTVDITAVAESDCLVSWTGSATPVDVMVPPQFAVILRAADFPYVIVAFALAESKSIASLPLVQSR